MTNPLEAYEEFKRWVAPLKPDTLPSYKYTMRLYTERTGLNPRQLVDEAEKDAAKPARERGAPARRIIAFYTYLTTEYRPKARGRKKEGQPVPQKPQGKDRPPKVGISPYKARGMAAVLRSFYSRNGFNLGEIPLPKVAPRKENERVEFSIEDVRRLVEIAPGKRDKALILFGFQGAFDADTVLRLNLGDLQDRDLKKLLDNTLPETPILLNIVREKEGVSYSTCLGYDAVEALRAYLQERKRRGEILTLDSPVFVKEGRYKHKNERMDKTGLHYLMRDLADKAGIVSLERQARADINLAGYHALRSTFSKRLQYAGMPSNYIDYCQGHTLPHGGAYTKPSPRNLLEKYKELEEHISISQAPAGVAEIEERLKKELEKRDHQARGMEARIEELERRLMELATAELKKAVKSSGRRSPKSI